MLDQVDEVVERFIDAYADVLKVRVRFVAADSPKWRYAIFSRLNPLGSGPQGQQIWSVKAEDAAMVIAQIGINQGGKPLTDQTVQVVNGQKITVETLVAPLLRRRPPAHQRRRPGVPAGQRRSSTRASSCGSAPC